MEQKEAGLLACLLAFQPVMACFADNMVSWEIVLATTKSTACPLCKDHSWPIVRIESDDNDQSAGQVGGKGNSSTDHCNSPN